MRRKHFLSVSEYAKEKHYTPHHVRRQIREGKINAQKIGRNWQILVDQGKKARVTWRYYAPGKKVAISPIAPDGLIWDMAKGRFVPIEKYAKEHGYPVVREGGKRLVGITPSHGSRTSMLSRLGNCPKKEGGKILLVCSGNTCRSPMAKVILEEKLEERGQLDRFEIDSAAHDGTSLSDVSENARTAIIKIYGQDLLASHKSKKLTDEIIEQADLILAMTGAIKNELPPGKSWTLKKYAGSSGDIPDLFGNNLEKYLECAYEISGLMDSIVEKLR